MAAPIGGFSLSELSGVAGGVTGGMGSMISGLFGKKKIEPLSYNKPARQLLEDQIGWIRSDNPAIESGLSDYSAATKKRAANTARLGAMEEADRNSIIARNRMYDPVLTSGRLLDKQTGALRDMMGNAGDLGRREQSLAMASLGRGGVPRGGSYERALVADRTARVFAPQFGNIISNLPSLYSATEGARLSGLGVESDAIARRTALSELGEGMELRPSLARLAIRDSQTGNILGNVRASAANTAGFEQRGNYADQLGGAMQEAGGYLMAGGAAAGGGGGGGMGGGGFGGMPGQFGGFQPSMAFGMPGQGWGYGGGYPPMSYYQPAPYLPVGPYGYDYNSLSPSQQYALDYAETYG